MQNISHKESIMRNEKETSIRLILIGLLLKLTPLFILGAAIQSSEIDIDSLRLRYSLIIVICVICFFFAGYFVSIKGCRRYIKTKGYSINWGWLGLLSVYGLPFLLLAPNKNRHRSPQTSDRILTRNWPEEIDILELILCGIFAIPSLIYMGIWLISLFSKLSFAQAIEDPTLRVIIGFTAFIIWTISIINLLQRLGVNIPNLIGYQKNITWRLIAIITAIKIMFAWGANSLTLYYFSFAFPSYVEAYINTNRITSISSAILYCLLSIFLAPLVEEFFYRGMILQKWSIKWGMRLGIVSSSLLFAIFHFRFDVLTLFISGVLYAILFFKSCSLITPILCHAFYNAFVSVSRIISFIEKSQSSESIFVSAENYQKLVEPLLSLRFFVLAISIGFLSYFISKNFPREYSVIPSLPPVD